jgi:hypothetical protein
MFRFSQTLMIALLMVVDREIRVRLPQRVFPEQDHLLQHDSLILRTNRSAWAFRFGDRGGNFTDCTPALASMVRNSSVKSGSRP